MSSSYLNKEGLARLWYQISDQFVKKEAGKGLFSGNYADLTGAPTNVSALCNMERATGLGPATSTLARWRSTR